MQEEAAGKIDAGLSDHRAAMLGSYAPQEGQAYNGLVVAWPQIQRLAP